MLKLVWDLIFPVLCQSCGDEGAYLCLACQEGLQPAEDRCPACGREFLLGRIHRECQSAVWALDGLLVATSYHSGAIQSLIWHLKYKGIRNIAEVLGVIMIDHLLQLDLLDYFSAAFVMPVPLHKKRERERGYNQAQLLSEVVAGRLGLMHRPILERVRDTGSQVDLRRESRLANVTSAFSAHPNPAIGDSRILLIDDVATTGATLNECAKVLKAQEAAEVWGLVVARN